MRTAIDSFFFDLDGTLVDSLPGIEQSVRAAVSGRVPSLRPLIGPPIRSILRSIRPRATEVQLDAFVLRFRTAYDSAGWRHTVPQPGTVEILNKLRKRGDRLFLVTNKPADAAAKILGMLEIRGYFTEVLARNSRDPAFDSKTEMLRWLLKKHRLSPQRCLMVGDTAEDYISATEAGIRAAIVANGYGACGGYPPACRVGSLKDLLSALDAVENRASSAGNYFRGSMPADVITARG